LSWPYKMETTVITLNYLMFAYLNKLLFTLYFFFFNSLFFKLQVTKETESRVIGLVSVEITMEDAIHKLHVLKIKVKDK
jgi:hypothetical protein